MYVFFLILIQLCDSRKAIRVISVFSVKFNVDFTRQAVNFSIILLSLKKRYMGKREKCKNWNKCPFLSGMILSLNLSKCCQIISGMNPQRKALRNMTLTRDELTSKRMGVTSLTPVSNEVHSLLRMARLKICKILVGISSVIPLNMDHIKKKTNKQKKENELRKSSPWLSRYPVETRSSSLWYDFSKGPYLLSINTKTKRSRLTNREALTVLCSVIEHAGSG